MVAGFGFWLVMTGRLIPKPWADKIFETNSKQSEALQKYTESWPQVLESMQTTNHFLRELQQVRERLQDNDGGGT